MLRKTLERRWRRLTVPIRYLWARLRYRRGDLRAARLSCQRLIRDVPAHFGARILLGRIHLRQKDFVRAKHEFLTAREIDPARFLRLTNSFDGPASESGGIRINLFYFSNASGGADEVPAGAGVLGALLGDEDWCEGRDASDLRFGDFMNYGEYRKFRSMPAITDEEIEGTNWDEVLTELYGEDGSD